MDTLCSYVNDQPYFAARNARMTRIIPAGYLNTFDFDIRLSTNAAIKYLGTISGGAFDKLGYDVDNVARNNF